MKIFLFTFLVFTTFYLTSCQKNFELENSNAIISLPDSNYLKKIFYLAKNPGGSYDTNVIAKVNYDNQKRVISMLQQNGIGNFLTDHYYYYNTNDNLPYKSMHASTDLILGENDTAILNHTYNAMGNKIKDSSNTVYHNPQIFPPVPVGREKSVAQYSYGAGKIFGETIFLDASNSPSYYVRDTAVVDIGNNITSSDSYYLFMGVYTLTNIYTYTYDTKINPFAKLRLHKVQRYFEDDFYQFFETHGQKNIIGYSKGGFTDYLSSYTYNSAGYPLTQTGISEGEEFKIIYTYTTL